MPRQRDMVVPMDPVIAVAKGHVLPVDVLVGETNLQKVIYLHDFCVCVCFLLCLCEELITIIGKYIKKKQK